MTDEFALKDANGHWVPGFPSRQAAIDAGIAQGRTQLTTAKLEFGCPSYFARFEAKTILARMISGLKYGEEIGKLVGGGFAVDFLESIESAKIGLDEEVRKEFLLQIDLMNRMEATLNAWIVENDLQFERPKFIVYMSEELHIAGSELNIQLL